MQDLLNMEIMQSTTFNYITTQTTHYHRTKDETHFTVRLRVIVIVSESIISIEIGYDIFKYYIWLRHKSMDRGLICLLDCKTTCVQVENVSLWWALEEGSGGHQNLHETSFGCNICTQ